MFTTVLRCTLALAALYLTATAAHAQTLTSSSQLMASNSLIDFQSLSLGPTSNPLVIGSVTFSASNSLAIEDISGYGASGTEVQGHVLRSNGTSPLGYAGYVDIRIDFSAPVGEVGLGWFDGNLTGNELRFFNAANVLLNTAAIPNNPAGGGFAEFRGFHSATNNIAYVIAKVSATNDVYGIDNVSFGLVSDVPEPSAAALVIGGLIALGGRSALRRKPRG